MSKDAMTKEITEIAVEDVSTGCCGGGGECGCESNESEVQANK